MKFRKPLIFIFVPLTVFLLIIGVYFTVKRQNPELDILSPISRSISIFSLLAKREQPKKIIYGYLPYWSLNETKYLQLDKLTDIAYFGLHIDEKGNFQKIADGETIPGYNQWKNNKELPKLIKDSKKNNVRFALTVISHQDDISDRFLDCRQCWDTLANNIVSELKEKEIKDVNLNFEYVEYTPKEKAHQYTEFVAFLNNRLKSEFDDPRLVVSTFADSIVKDRVTLIDEVGKVSDYLFIMAYDFHRPTSDTAGPVAPLDGKGVYAEYDINTMLKDYLSAVPPTKIILGVPYYGYNWVVKEDKQYSERIEGRDDIGYSQSQTYENIMETIITLKPDVKWDDLAKTPYFTYKSPETGSIRQVYFDNSDSLSEKYNLVNNNNLAGVGIWALGYDGGYRELWNLLADKFIN